MCFVFFFYTYILGNKNNLFSTPVFEKNEVPIYVLYCSVTRTFSLR